MAVTETTFHNTAGKMYYIVPSLIGTGFNPSQIVNQNSVRAASTSVLCPMKPLGDHSGFSTYAGTAPTQTLKGVKPYFSEIVGVIPTVIKKWGSDTPGVSLSEANLKNYIKEINYRYLDNGHKVISIVYDQDTFQPLRSQEIEFKILFDGGDYHTVKQPIVNGMCVSESHGAVFDYSTAFDFSELDDYLPNGFSTNSKVDKPLGGLKRTNVGPNKGTVGFDTFAYTDPKWADQNLLLGSENNRDYFQICPLFDHQPFTYGPSQTTDITVQPYGEASNVTYTINPDNIHYEFRQTTRANYGSSGSGVSDGSFNNTHINPLQDIYFSQSNTSSSRFANFCYYSLDWLALHVRTINITGEIIDDVPGNFPPGPFGPEDVKTASIDETLFSYPAGWFGTAIGAEEPGYSREKASAFHVRNTAAAKQQDHNTARRFDGLAWTIRKKNLTTFSEAGFNSSTGFDTDSGFLRGIVDKFISGIEEHNNSGASFDYPIGSFMGKGNLQVTGTTDSARAMIDLGMMHPGDFLANFLLGNHGHYFSYPSNATDPSNEVTAMQRKFTTSLFCTPDPNDQLLLDVFVYAFHFGSTTTGVQVGGSQAPVDEQLYITACPYHLYIDAFHAFEGNDTGYVLPAPSFKVASTTDEYQASTLPFSDFTQYASSEFEKYYFGEDTGTKYLFQIDASRAARIGDGGDEVREQRRILEHSSGIAVAHSAAGVYFGLGPTSQATKFIGQSNNAHAFQTLDRNTTYFNGEILSPNADNEMEIVPGNDLIIDILGGGDIVTNGLSQLHNIQLAMEGSSFYTQKSVLCNSSFSQKATPSARRAFARGCIPFERQQDPLNTKVFELRVITGTNAMFSGSNISELEFNFPYLIGTDNYLPDTVINPSDDFVNYVYGSSIVGGQGGVLDCGCGGFASQFQYTAFGAGIDTPATSSIGNDIFDIRYTPGRHTVDSDLFPINNNEFSTAFVIADGGNGQPNSSSSTMKYTSRLIGQNPVENDRLLTDVEIGEFDWGPDALHISTIDIAAAADDAAGNYTNVQRGKNSIADSGYEDGTKSIDVNAQRFQFVAIGQQLVEGGGIVDDIPGCTNSAAFNFNPEATVDDGTCAECIPENIATIADALSENSSIDPNAGITGTNQPFGMTNYYTNTTYQNGIWHEGQIGNAFNHWGFDLQEAIDYSAGADGIVIPFGEAWEAAGNSVSDTAAPFTEFVFKTDFSEFTGVGPGAQTGFANWLTSNQDIIQPEGLTLRIYDIDDWQGGAGDWAQVYDQSPGVTTNNVPLTDFSSPILIMTNQATTNTEAVFATYDYNTHGDNPDYNSESFDILTDPHFQDKLKAGKHYVALLTLEADTYLDAKGDCQFIKVVPFNFWVMFCGCDVFDSPTYVGDVLSDLPWWQNATFPAGYSLISQCTSEALSRRIAGDDDLQDGYCAPRPDPFTCDNFIDACVNNSTFDCVYAEGESEGIVTGTISVDVYGAYTNNIDGIDNYAYELGGELFTFNLYLIEGEWNGVTPPSQLDALEVITIGSVEDYNDYQINPSNAADGPLHHVFQIVGSGVFSIILEQTGFFESFQDGPCPPIVVGETTITAQVNGETECPDRIIGCQDPQAINFDCLCGNEDYTNGGCSDGVTVSADPSCCIYVDCNDVYLDGKITSTSSTNTTQDCVQTSDEDVLINTLVDSFSGTITVDGFDATVSGGSVTGTFVMAVMGIVDGQASDAVDTILGVIENQNGQVFDTTRTSPIAIEDGPLILGYIAGFTAAGLPVQTVEGLAAGNYVVMMVNNYVTDIDESCEGVGFVDNFDSINFELVGATVSYTDCPSPCNDQDNPEDCPDIVGGCTDENASNYNENADYNDGTCDYSDTDPCDQGQDAEGCEDCESAAAAGLNTRRDCDEFNETTEGCCDPLACNYDPTVDVCLESRCEFCCDGTEDCSDDDTTDECEDEDGNILPDCIVPECPDPNNPDCDTVVVDPCPNGDCGTPPDPICVTLGNCPEGGNDGGGDPTVIFDFDYVNEVYCEPNFGSSTDFGEVQRAAMTCSANEGSKLLFKLRSGVKYDRTDLIKLELINYLFNNAMVNPCMSTCESTQDARALDKGINRNSCRDTWSRTGKEYWAKSSTYAKGTVVALIYNVLGTIRRRYFRATRNVNAGELRPDASVGNLKTTGWTPCVEFRGVKSQTGEEPYAFKLYEFMIKYCEQCNVYSQAAADKKAKGGTTRAVDRKELSGLLDNEGNVIKLF